MEGKMSESQQVPQLSRYKPESLFQALQGYITWTDRLIEAMNKVGSRPRTNWPKPKKREIGIPMKMVPVREEDQEFHTLQQLRKERYEYAYQLADSEKSKTDNSRTPLAERWSTRLRATILRSAIGINTLFPIPEDELPQFFVNLSYNRKAIENLRRSVTDLNIFLSTLGVLYRGSTSVLNIDASEPSDADIQACLSRLKLNGDDYKPGNFFQKRWHISLDSLRQALLAREILVRKGPHKNSPNDYQIRSVARRFWDKASTAAA